MRFTTLSQRFLRKHTNALEKPKRKTTNNYLKDLPLLRDEYSIIRNCSKQTETVREGEASILF